MRYLLSISLAVIFSVSVGFSQTTLTADTARVQILLQTAIEHYHHARYDSLLAVSQQALQLAQQQKFGRGIARAYNLIGIAQLLQSDLLKAQQYFDSTRLTFQTLRDSVGLTMALCNLGHVQESYGDYEQALHYYWREFSVSEAIGDTSKMGSAYEDIGRVQQAQNNHRQALPYYEQALAFFQSQNNGTPW